MRRRTTLSIVTLVLSLAACLRPIHERTWVVGSYAGARYDHPAHVAEAALELALAGRVDDADRPGLAAAMARAFPRLRPDQVIYYRHPGGGAYLFGVRAGKLVVTPVGLRARGGAPPAEYALTDLQNSSPPKRAARGDVTDLAAGATGAELEVESAFAVPQFVFADGVFLGTVAPGATRVFPIAAGHAHVVAADGQDGKQNAVEDDFDFVPGKRYHWSIEPRL